MKYSPATDIPDLSGKVVLITGGTDGLGKESLRQLSRHNPSKVYLTARNMSKAQSTLNELQSQHPPEQSLPPTEILIMDLSSLSSVHKAAQKFLIQEDRLDILLCNAGILSDCGVTEDGYEIVFGTNHLGHTLLISLLLPRLLTTAKLPGVEEGDTRCVILGSSGEKLATKDAYLFNSIHTDLKGLSFWARYGQSKLANIQTTQMLAESYPESETGVRFVCVHPGNVSTNMGSAIIPNKHVRQILKVISHTFFGVVSPEIGVYNQLWAATGPSRPSKANADVAISCSGEFYYPVGKSGKGSKKSRDMKLARTLWDWTEKELQPWLTL